MADISHMFPQTQDWKGFSFHDEEVIIAMKKNPVESYEQGILTPAMIDILLEDKDA